jgi:NAD(P)-dependent dehydrogenase (short-subunit alcohol dehydrogenase family)
VSDTRRPDTQRLERVSGPIPSEALGLAKGRGRLAGRKILVVGAGTRPSDEPDAPIGNGRAIAVLAAREGAAVACADVDAAAARETLARVEKEGARGLVITADVADPAACDRIVAEAVTGLGGLDGVVLNVGIARGARLAGTDAAGWDEALNVNLRAHFLIARAALPRLTAGASIVFISSIAALQPGTRAPSYDASKAGLAGLMRHVAFEGSRAGIRANVLLPGLIDTPLGRLASRGRPGRARTPVPLGRQGTGWEVAYAALFLLSDEASYVTGQSLVVDGGLSALGPG